MEALARDGLTTAWLATRLGIQSARVDAMRRSGELLGVPVPDGREHVYPAGSSAATASRCATCRRWSGLRARPASATTRSTASSR